VSGHGGGRVARSGQKYSKNIKKYLKIVVILIE